MKRGHSKTHIFLAVIVILINACNLPQTADIPQATPPPNEITALTQPPTAIQHQIYPINLPGQRSSHAGDYDSSTTVGTKLSAGGDRFTYEQFERPFNADTMDVYFPYLDIQDTLAYQDDIWIYGTMLLRGLDNNSLPGKYGIQLDVDLDGKGDWLVIASNPSSADWTTDGVQVFQDANHDVGAVIAMFTDDNKAYGDGFETQVFDQGQGNDPDTAWVRVPSDKPGTVEIAVKRALVGGGQAYLMNMWAGNSMMDPALFDLSDHFTHEQAGAADPGLEFYYPIKAVSELDNSCRMAIGFQPTGKEPGLCKEFKPGPVPGAPVCPYTCPYGQDPYPSCLCWLY